jgi:hypothetical protein
MQVVAQTHQVCLYGAHVMMWLGSTSEQTPSGIGVPSSMLVPTALLCARTACCWPHSTRQVSTMGSCTSIVTVWCLP